MNSSVTKDRNCLRSPSLHRFWRSTISRIPVVPGEGMSVKVLLQGPATVRAPWPILLRNGESEGTSRQSTRFLSFCTAALIDRSKDDGS